MVKKPSPRSLTVERPQARLSSVPSPFRPRPCSRARLVGVESYKTLVAPPASGRAGVGRVVVRWESVLGLLPVLLMVGHRRARRPSGDGRACSERGKVGLPAIR